MKKNLLIVLLLIFLYPKMTNAATGKDCTYVLDNGASVAVQINATKKKNLTCSATITGWPNQNKVNKKVECGLWASDTKNAYLTKEIADKKEVCPSYVLVSYKKNFLSANAELYIHYSKNVLEKKQKILKNKSFIIESSDFKNDSLNQKVNCEDFTYDECINKTDINGNVCIKDKNTNTCRKKMTCGEYTTEKSCPAKGDYGKCKWNSDSKKCEKYDKFLCTDYLTKETCKIDEEGNKCVWRAKSGCNYRNSTDDPNAEKISIKTDNIDCDNVFNGKFGTLLKDILSLIRFVVPIIILGLSIFDYIKAITAQDAMEMKKASLKLAKRLVIGVIIFVLPTLLEVLLSLVGIEFGVCDIK